MEGPDLEFTSVLSSYKPQYPAGDNICGPPPRIRFSSVQLSEKVRFVTNSDTDIKLFIFGGSGPLHTSYWNDLFIFDCKTLLWEEVDGLFL